MAPASKEPGLRRPGDPPARYGPLEEKFTVEINYAGFFCGFGSAKSYVDGKVARFDRCDADTWSPLWLTDFMQQLGYPDPNKYMLYWLLPGMDLGTGLRIVDCDTDTLSMIAVVPKFQYFQMFVNHKDMQFDNGNIDDVVITGSPVLHAVLSPGSNTFQASKPDIVGHEPRRSRRKLMEEEAPNCTDNDNADSDSEDSEYDEEWVDSDNEVAEDDDDLYEEWVDDKLEEKIDFANNYEATPAAEQLFKVVGLRGEYEVNLKKMECSCRAWQLSGIPCRHACACLRHERIKPESVVHKCYSIEAFKASYGHVIMPCSDPKVWPKMNGPAMKPPKFDKQVGRPSKKRRKSPLEEEDGTRMSRHGIIGHCSVCNSIEHNKRKCPELGRVQHAADAAPREQEQAVAAAPEAEHVAAPEADHATTPTSPITELRAQIVFAGDEYEVHAQPPKKMPVKRNNNSKKKTLPKPSASATASLVESAMSYDISSTSVIHILQEQAAATQQSQTLLPGPLPESRFIASCRDDLPPPRSTTATLGLKRRKRVVKKKENMIPKV